MRTESDQRVLVIICSFDECFGAIGGLASAFELTSKYYPDAQKTDPRIRISEQHPTAHPHPDDTQHRTGAEKQTEANGACGEKSQA